MQHKQCNKCHETRTMRHNHGIIPKCSVCYPCPVQTCVHAAEKGSDLAACLIRVLSSGFALLLTLLALQVVLLHKDGLATSALCVTGHWRARGVGIMLLGARLIMHRRPDWWAWWAVNMRHIICPVTMQEGVRVTRYEAWRSMSVVAQIGFEMEAGPLWCMMVQNHNYNYYHERFDLRKYHGLERFTLFLDFVSQYMQDNFSEHTMSDFVLDSPRHHTHARVPHGHEQRLVPCG